MAGKFAALVGPEPWLLPGDVMLTTDPESKLSAAIRWASRDRSRGESASVASHGGLVVSAGAIHDVAVVEAVGKVRKVTVGQAYPSRTLVAVYRAINIPKIDLSLIVVEAHKDLGKGYPYWQLVFHLLDSIIPGQPKIFRRLAGISGKLVCTGFLGKWFAKLGYTFGTENPEALTPDDIDDYASAMPRHWVLVRKWAPLGDRLPDEG